MGTYIDLVAGRLKRVAAILTSSGSGDSGKIAALDATGKLDISFMPTGLGANTKSAITSEAIVAGNLVNLYNNAGVTTARKADNTAAGKEANAVALAGFSSGATGTFYLAGVTITGLSSLTPGAIGWLGTTGAITFTAPTTSGNVSQRVGFAEDATSFYFFPAEIVDIG